MLISTLSGKPTRCLISYVIDGEGNLHQQIISLFIFLLEKLRTTILGDRYV